MADKDDLVRLTARVKPETKENLEAYCRGDVDGQKHIQEDVVEIAINRHVNYAKKVADVLPKHKERK